MATYCQAGRGRHGEHSLEKNMISSYKHTAHLKSVLFACAKVEAHDVQNNWTCSAKQICVPFACFAILCETVHNSKVSKSFEDTGVKEIDIEILSLFGLLQFPVISIVTNGCSTHTHTRANTHTHTQFILKVSNLKQQWIFVTRISHKIKRNQ